MSWDGIDWLIFGGIAAFYAICALVIWLCARHAVDEPEIEGIGAATEGPDQ